MQFGNPLSLLLGAVTPIATVVGISNVGIGNIFLPNGTFRTLFLRLTTSDGNPITNVQVSGQTSGLLYYNQPPYLPPEVTLVFGYEIVVPIFGGIDTSIQVIVTKAGGTWSLVAYGDSLEIPESTFYNGVLKTAGVYIGGITAGTQILPGPARLLTLQAEIIGAGTLQIFNSSAVFIRLDGSAGSTVNDTMSFPPNTILKAGDSLTLSTSAAVVQGCGVTYAYP